MDEERLVVALEARIRDFERSFQRATRTASTNFDSIEARAKRSSAQLEKTMAGASDRIGRSLKGLGATFLAGMSLQGAKELVDASTRITNALKVTGLEGNKLTSVYDQLFESAQKNAAPLETMVDLYSKISQSADTLGVSQQRVIGFVDRIGVALRVAGTDATAASGALTQLAQALGSGTVRAEEFNSINEGARPILQAVAAGLKEAGGSVAKLRQIMLDGELSSKVFFEAMERGSVILDQKVATAGSTVSQSFVRLQNTLIDTAGKLNETTGASERVGAGLEKLSNVIVGLNQVFEAAANGPIGKFIEKLEKLNSLIQAVEPMNQMFNWVTGDGNLKAVADAIQPGKVESEVDKIRAEIVDRNKQLETEGEFFGGIIKARLDQLYDRLEALEQSGPSTRGGNRRPTVANPVSLGDQPAGASPAASTDRAAASADRAAESFDGLGEAVRDFVDNVVRVESGGDPNATNSTSTATGLGGFIESTWLSLFKKYYPQEAANMSRDAILALRKDSEISRAMIANYARENAAIMRQAGIAVDQAALQLAHFLGPGGAIKVLKAAPGTPISQVVDQAAIRANPSILGGNRTVDDVIAYARSRAQATTKNREFAASEKDVASSIRTTRTAATETQGAVEQLGESYSMAGEIGMTAFRGLMSALSDGKIDAQEMLQIVMQVVEQFIQMQSMPGAAGMWGNGGGASKAGGGLLSWLFGGFGGFAEGGFTGPGGRLEPAGLVHKGEFVMSKAATSRIGVANLDAIHRGALAGYAAGGFVGEMPALGRTSEAAPTITISAPVTVNGSAGTPEQNSDLAKRVAREMEASMRGVVVSELQNQLRPGNLGNQRAR